MWAGARSRTAVRDRTADDDAIVTELYRQYRVPLMAYVLRLTAGDRQHAEDVVQETMVRAWRQASQLDLTEPSLMPWLVTVARRIVIDDKRRRSARPAETGDDMLENAPAADTTEDLLRKMVVTEALQALSPAHREVLNETASRRLRSTAVPRRWPSPASCIRPPIPAPAWPGPSAW